MIFGVDPGETESAYVVFDSRYPERPLERYGKIANFDLLRMITDVHGNPLGEHMAIEMIASYGMSVGASVFETCLWIGRFIEAYRRDYTKVYRREVKIHLCGSMRAKDGNVRAALIDRWGGKTKAIGSKAAPGPLYGVSADVWQALAVAVTFADAQRELTGKR